MPFVTVRAAGCLGKEEQKWWSIHCIKAQAGSGSSRSRRRGGGWGHSIDLRKSYIGAVHCSGAGGFAGEADGCWDGAKGGIR